MNAANYESNEITDGDEKTTVPTAEGLARRLEDAVERSMSDLETENAAPLIPSTRAPEEIASG